jgi:hypothetical protein
MMIIMMIKMAIIITIIMMIMIMCKVERNAGAIIIYALRIMMLS